MGYCKSCNNVLMRTLDGERCRYPRCWTNTFVQGSIVSSKRHPDHGLGRVVGFLSDGSRANVLYESGISAVENLHDICHAELAPGRIVELAQGKGAVMGTEPKRSHSGYLYTVRCGQEVVRVEEPDITALPQTAPVNVFLAGNIMQPETFRLRNRALHFKVAQAGDHMLCIHNSRVELMRHQVMIAHRAVQDHNPRYILADEVGLGKTMEAGLVLKEMKARRLAGRILIITPSSLVQQWATELRTKFNEDFQVYDSARLRTATTAAPDDGAFTDARNVLMSLQFARKDNVAAALASESWDIVIFDEAHHLRRRLEGGEVKITKAYRLAEVLRDRCGAMLLLTATPLQLHPYEFYSLLELIDPGRFQDFWTFEVYRQKALPQLNSMVSLLEAMGPGPPEDGALERMKDFIGTMEWLRKHVSMPTETGRTYLDGWELKVRDHAWRREMLTEARDYQVVSKCMMRNRKAEVFPGGPRRKAVTVQLQFSQEEKMAYDLVSAYVRAGYNRARQDRNTALGFVMVIFQKLLTSSRPALVSAFRKRMHGLGGPGCEADMDDLDDFDMLEEMQQDELLERLYGIDSDSDETTVLAELIRMLEAIDHDTKREALVNSIGTIMESNPGEKILIFTQFHATQRYLRDALSENYRVVMFNGKMSPQEKEAAIREFKDSARIMISTEAGGEGRNFQFCHVMFNYDLPWNPMRLEQRIGRLDRIGQDRMVYIYNFSYGETVEQRILDALYERIGMFEETIGAMEPILGDIEREMAELVLADVKNLDRAIERYQRSLGERVAEARDIERRLRDFTLDRRLFQLERVEALLNSRPIIPPDMLKRFVIDFLTVNGGTVTGAYEDITTLRVPPGLLHGSPGGAVLSGTFDPDVARKNENLDFIAFGHPFIEDCLDAAAGDMSMPSVSVLSMPGSNASPGVLFLYRVDFTDLRRTRRLVPVFIGHDMHYSRKESEALLEKLLGSRGGVAPGQVPAQGFDFEAHSSAADVALRHLIGSMLKGIRTDNTERLRQEKARLERLYSFKAKKLNDQISRDSRILGEFRVSQDEGKRKLVPAYAARVERAMEELEGLMGEREYCLRELGGSGEIDATARGVGAAVFI